MMRRETLAEGVLSCKPWLTRYLAGFDDTNHTAQPPGLPNHVAWSLGHLAITMHRAAEKIDGKPPPESDFIAADRGDKSRFGTESVSFASTPTSDPAAYPPMARCREIYELACDRLAAAIRAAEESDLDRPVKWGQAETTRWALAQRMIYHNGTHTGQIADLRRALKMKSIFA